MAITIDCFDLALRGLKDPYTGVELTFKLILSGGGAPRMFSPNAYSISTVYPTSEECLRKATARNGIEGVIELGASLKCPYTGAPLLITGNKEVGYHLLGGFDPTIPLFEAPDFIEKVTSVDGVSAHPKRTIPYAKVISRDESEAPEIETPDALDISQDSLDVIKAIVDGPKSKKTVAVNGRKKK